MLNLEMHYEFAKVQSTIQILHEKSIETYHATSRATSNFGSELSNWKRRWKYTARKKGAKQIMIKSRHFHAKLF